VFYLLNEKSIFIQGLSIQKCESRCVNVDMFENFCYALRDNGICNK
jgi:hypothetical protein